MIFLVSNYLLFRIWSNIVNFCMQGNQRIRTLFFKLKFNKINGSRVNSFPFDLEKLTPITKIWGFWKCFSIQPILLMVKKPAWPFYFSQCFLIFSAYYFEVIYCDNTLFPENKLGIEMPIVGNNGIFTDNRCILVLEMSMIESKNDASNLMLSCWEI